MTPEQKAAAILALAGEENASKLIKNIPSYEVKKILRSFSRLPALGDKEIDLIAKEFLAIIKSLDQKNNKFSLEKAKRILRAANGVIKDDNWIESISDSFLIEEIRNILNTLDEKTLLSWLKHELPQTMSLVLAICNPQKTSSLMKHLRTELSCEILLRISQMNHVDTPELENIYEEIKKMEKNVNPIQESVGGFKKILAVLQAAPYEQRSKLLDDIEAKEPELAEKLKYALVSIERISTIDQTHLSLLCANLPDKVLSLALRLEGTEVKEKFLSTLSKKRREIIEDDMKESKMPKKEAENASTLIVKKALELKEMGKIVFPWEETLV